MLRDDGKEGEGRCSGSPRLTSSIRRVHKLHTEAGLLSVSTINERLKTEHSYIRFRSCIIKTSLEEILQLLERVVERFYTLNSKAQAPFPPWSATGAL